MVQDAPVRAVENVRGARRSAVDALDQHSVVNVDLDVVGERERYEIGKLGVRIGCVRSEPPPKRTQLKLAS